MTFLPQDVCEANLASQDLCLYDADELESAWSLQTLKSANLRTEHCTGSDRTKFQQFNSTDPIGVRYIRKHTNSDNSTSTGAKQQELISTYPCRNITRVKSFDDLTQNCINSIYEYVYATVAGTEATTDSLKNEPSIVTYNLEKPHTENLDSISNKIKESNLTEHDTISSSKNLTNIDINNSIIKLTSQMKRNFITAKADFDKYVKQNLKSNKDMDKDSVTANESQVQELFTDS